MLSKIFNRTFRNSSYNRTNQHSSIYLFLSLLLLTQFNAQAQTQLSQVSQLTQESQPSQVKWVSTFGAPPQKSGLFRPPFDVSPLTNQTVRNIVHVSLGGQTVRVRLSNTFGSEPLTVDQASVALFDAGQFNQVTSLSFNGLNSTVIPVGADVYSDPVSLEVPNDSDLAVSIYVAGNSGSPTIEDVTNKTSYVMAGNQTMGASLPTTYQSIDYGYFMRGVEVKASKRASVIATFGSSILDGFNSGLDANNSFTNYLSRRLHERDEFSQYSAVSACISGNRLLDESSVFGRAGLARIDDDVLAQSGVEHVVMLLGRNDIVFPVIAAFLPPNDRALTVTVPQMIAGLKQIAAKAKANNVKISVGTYIPYNGSFTYSDEGNEIRLAVNDWLRESGVSEGGFTSVIDFEAVMKDPNDSNRLNPIYDSGDGSHPNAAGYEAMANAVDLSVFRH